MNDTLRRTIRTFLQANLVSGFILLYNEFALVPITGTQAAAIMGVSVPLITFAHNLLESIWPSIDTSKTPPKKRKRYPRKKAAGNGIPPPPPPIVTAP